MKKWMAAFVLSMLIIPSMVQWVYPFDHNKFDVILEQYVDEDGLVDYNGIAGDQRFSVYIESLESATVETLSHDGQLAFWINAYNAITIDKVIKWKPEKSVRETLIPGVWTSTKFFTSREHVVAGRRMGPDDIEHEILRKQFKDPRIHFAIICASSSCPKLPGFAYTEENVQKKLEQETWKYMNSDRGIRIDRAENTIYLSKIFDWFQGDFIGKSGSVMNFIRPYLKEEVISFLGREPKIDYIPYNWALNAKEPVRYTVSGVSSVLWTFMCLRVQSRGSKLF
ncbi:MAG: DUF547 domain-containing protein [Proteobacteria bacterium]|nr:DUF547 domain-containing protein [Pseudomonadota bacterium]NIS71081.1 DUF547 domain-containing protein [Pseudomonadota bacterium]